MGVVHNVRSEGSSNTSFNISNLLINTDERVIVFLSINDPSGTETFTTAVEDNDGSDELTFTKIFTTSIVTTTSGKLTVEAWISDKSAHSDNSYDIDIVLSGGSSLYTAAIAASVSDLYADDAIVVESIVGLNGTSNTTTLTTTPITPVNPDGLGIIFWATDNENTGDSASPTGGYSLIQERKTGSDGDGSVGFLASRTTVTLGADTSSTMTIDRSDKFVGINLLLLSKLEASVDHITDSLLAKTSVIDHDTDVLLDKTSVLDHDADTLLSLESTRFNSSDTLLQATITTDHYSDMLIKPPPQLPILRRLLINNVPSSQNIGSSKIRILGVHGNGISEDDFIYTLNPQEFMVGKNQTNQLNIVDPIIKKDYESTIIEEVLEPAGQVPLDNLVFQGYPAIFSPYAASEEEFTDGWVKYAGMSDDPSEEGFEETPNSWNDAFSDSWSKSHINPDDNLSSEFQRFTNGNVPGVPIKTIENSEEWYLPSPITIVQMVGYSKTAGGSTTIPVEFPLPIANGNILVVAACVGLTSIASITQSGVTWVDQSCGSAVGTNTHLMIGHTVVSASQSFSIILSSAAYSGSFIIAEIAGLDPASTVEDKAHTKTSTANIITDTTDTADHQNTLWLSAFGLKRPDRDSSVFTQDNTDNSWNVLYEQPGDIGDTSTGTRIILYQQIRQGIDIPKISLVAPATVDYGLVMRTLKPV